MRGLVLVCALISAASTARGDQASEAEGRRLYEEGREAYERRDCETAYRRFRASYLLVQRPELLFNMASAQKDCGRPHEAAENLRAYLRVVPDSPDRPAIEQRVLALEEAQRILDEAQPRSSPAPIASAPITSAAPSAVVAAPAPPAPKSSRRTIAIAVGVSLGVAALGLAIGLGVGLSQPAPPYSPSTTGPVPGTR